MSAYLQKQPNWCVAAIRRFVPQGDICSAAKIAVYSITSSVRAFLDGQFLDETAQLHRTPGGRAVA
jgi:hypothetical protein